MKSRSMAVVLAAAMTLAALPARADGESANILFGLLAAVGISLGIVAYQTDFHQEPELKVHDENADRKKADGQKKDGARLEIVPPPASSDEARPAEMAACLAVSAKF